MQCPNLFRLTLTAAAMTCLAHEASAAILTVGAPGTGCNHTNVQAAVDAANASAGADEIRIARSATWTAQQISINTNEEVRLVGGYASCTSASPDVIRTVLSGAGGNARPVLTIRGNGFVYLRNLTIRDGDQAGDDNGGGINFSSGGILDIADTLITANTANDGGGIYATGTSIDAEVVLGANVSINSNTARNTGGGMVSKSLETSIRGPGTSLLFNRALGQTGGGYGGGLVVVSEQFKSFAYISSNGVGNIGAIYGNEALRGGGIALLAGQDSAQEVQALIYSADTAQPVRINNNTASIGGGGIYVRPDADSGGAVGDATVTLWRAALNDNRAPDGAAAYVDLDEGVIIDRQGAFQFSAIAQAAPCPTGAACNEMIGNATENTTGAILRNRGNAALQRVAIRDNEGGRLLYSTDYARAKIFNSLIADNIVAQELIRSANADGDLHYLTLNHITIAGNVIGLPNVIFANHDFNFDRSLVAQPGKLTLATSGGVRDIEYVLTNDPSNMTGSFFLANPRFIDPAHGDYHLRAGSYAVDFAPNIGGTDLDGLPHTLDMPFGGIQNRTDDAGAYERPALQPLVINSDFNTDLNLWTGLSDSFWDGTTNASGPANSGSVRIPYVIDSGRGGGPRVVGRSQCVHLPAPGRYTLNGFGKVTSGTFDTNSARLVWELRYNGGPASCENGVYDMTNSHVLATSNTWRRPPNAAVIDVPANVWSRNTTLTIKLDTAGAPASLPTSWFDGITLDIDNSDHIFANGFD